MSREWRTSEDETGNSYALVFAVLSNGARRSNHAE